MNFWYEINNIEKVDSPSLVIYEENLAKNIDQMLQMVNGQTNRLMPHVKTNKMQIVMAKMVEKGIKRFKAATIAEAELAALAGASFVLIAHQLVGPKIERLLNLKRAFPKVKFASLVDDIPHIDHLVKTISAYKETAEVYIDINNGMDRTGVSLGENLKSLTAKIESQIELSIGGYHVYDGHLRDSIWKDRASKIEKGILEVWPYYEELKVNHPNAELIAGGTPTFSGHLLNNALICSPGTCVLWDAGYAAILQEQTFDFAALIISRVISKPTKTSITLDLGHKAVASENNIDKRIFFLNYPEAQLISQSEEHGVVKVDNSDDFEIGTVFYGLPHHICPSVNLYDTAFVVKNKTYYQDWKVEGRKRKINF